MNTIKSWVLKFLRSPVDRSYIETHEMLLRCARRCAYDLRHATDEISRLASYAGPRADKDLLLMYRERSDHWVSLFATGNAMKDYRLELEREITKRDLEIARLQRLCEVNDIAHEAPGCPF